MSMHVTVIITFLLNNLEFQILSELQTTYMLRGFFLIKFDCWWNFSFSLNVFKT